MRWYKATLYTLTSESTDKLGHPISEREKTGDCIVRKAPVKESQVSIEGNEHKTLVRHFLTTKNAKEFVGIAFVEVAGRCLRLGNVTSLENGLTMLECTYDRPEVDKCFSD